MCVCGGLGFWSMMSHEGTERITSEPESGDGLLIEWNRTFLLLDTPFFPSFFHSLTRSPHVYRVYSWRDIEGVPLSLHTYTLARPSRCLRSLTLFYLKFLSLFGSSFPYSVVCMHWEPRSYIVYRKNGDLSQLQSCRRRKGKRMIGDWLTGACMCGRR